MKRILAMALVAAFVLGMASMASATEIKVKGEMRFAFSWIDNPDFFDQEEDGKSEDDFEARQRVRAQIDLIASENLKGVLFFEMGETVWGSGGSVGRGSGGAIGTDGVNVETRRAYIDFTVPNTALSFRVGLQGFSLPTAGLGNPVWESTDAAGVVASFAASDMFSVALLWNRPYDNSGGRADDSPAHDELDIFGVLLPIALDGASLTPWAVYANVGKDTTVPGGLIGQIAPTDDVTAWWAGAALTIDMFDPIAFMLDVVYGATDADDDADRAGWYIAGELDYKMDMMTPGIAFWYATGEDDDATNGSETLPEVAGWFYGTTFGFDDYSVLSSGDYLSGKAIGSWGVALLVKNITFVEDLSHTLRIAYVQGTSDEDSVPVAPIGLTTEDSGWEVDFDHSYAIYENLAAIVELGYINVDIDGVDDTVDAWKLGFMLKYTF